MREPEPRPRPKPARRPIETVDPTAVPAATGRSRWAFGAALASVVLLLVFWFRGGHPAPSPADAPDNPNTRGAQAPHPAGTAPGPGPAFRRGSGRTPEQVVADRLGAFARKRLDAAQRLAQRAGVQVPPEVRLFFAAVEAGDWPRARALYEALQARRAAEVEPRPADLDAVWPAVHEAFGVAEIAATWPAKALMDYAEAVLTAIQPGTVFLGGTDAGRFAPLLFNDVGGADGRVILTQNALADVSYLDYVNLLHGTRIEALTLDDSTAAFSAYLEDSQRRAVHDAEHPEEPPQLRPGEMIEVKPDGQINVSGQVAVMAINEGLVRTLLAKNPDLHFALEESYPMKSLYADALPAGPVMELRAGGADPDLVRQRATESLELWRSTAERFRSDTSVAADSPNRQAWAEMAAAQAAYFAEHQLPDQAEETWRRAIEIGPGSTKALLGLAEHLAANQRQAEARQLVDGFLQANPSVPTDSPLLGLRDRLAAPRPPGGSP